MAGVTVMANEIDTINSSVFLDIRSKLMNRFASNFDQGTRQKHGNINI